MISFNEKVTLSSIKNNYLKAMQKETVLQIFITILMMELEEQPLIYMDFKK